MNILDEILEHKTERELPARKRARALTDIRRDALAAPQPKDFSAALAAPAERLALIAEIKRASPSKGDLVQGAFDAAAIATVYAANGARAISVLTDEKYFKGSLSHLREVRAKVTLPLLRKDFIVDEYQLHEARVNGADAVLLIAAAMNDDMLEDYLDIAHALKLAALVEVHDERELERALRADALLVGVNNRDLRTFQVDLQTTARVSQRLAQHRDLPHEVILVSESGIGSPADAARVAEMGARAILVGESLITHADIAAHTMALASVPRVRVAVQ